MNSLWSKHKNRDLLFSPFSSPRCCVGCKIKALRAKTNTYIKTPVRGEEPIFVITGRPEDVSAAKREILAAADHFTQIRASRRSSTVTSPSSAFGSPTEDNKVTILVRVPYRVVGLVVGPKGATVKRIQQLTNTYIVTPSRDREPCFEVTGSAENVERAKREIESYIALRTGGSLDSDYETDYLSLLSPTLDPVFSPSLGGNGNGSGSTGVPTTRSHLLTRSASEKLFQFPSRLSSSPPNTLALSTPMEGVELNNWGDKPTRCSPLSSAVFGAKSLSQEGQDSSLSNYSFTTPMSAPVVFADRVFDFSNLRASLRHQPPSPTGSWESNSSEGTAAVSPKNSPRLPQRSISLSCNVCRSREVCAALIPCGHNLFCHICAHKISTSHGSCPVCRSQVTNMLRLYQ
jgi:RNA-binding protein MEX3